jgi:pyruvate dehydrogenase E2 component (dihydrolipoamide acetyltransferase)
MDVKLPALGEGADSGTVVNIFVKEGDTIKRDQPVLELENEKAVATIPSTAEGVVTRVYVKSGDKISVGQSLISLTESTGSASEPAKAAETAKPAANAPQQQGGKAPASAPQPAPVATAPAAAGTPEPPAGVEPAASPSIRKLAQDLGIDLRRVRGSERGGRIVLHDIRAYIHGLQQAAAAPGTTSGPATGQPGAKAAPAPVDFSKWGPVKRQAMSPLRQVIARRMTENWNAIPHVTQFDEIDIQALNDLRKKFAPAYEKKGACLTITTFALKAVADTLQKHPIFNSSLDEAAQEIIFKDYVHIGIAVDTEAGLIVPVIRDVNKKSLLELSKELEDLATKARDRKTGSEELKGGSFTISNQGGIGGAHFTPIVNKPEVAILGMGRGVMKPVVRENKVEPRLLLPVALSYDHRVIDGGAAARFMVDLLKAFEGIKEDAVKLKA